MTQMSVTDDPQDLCNLFFNDSNQAIIIVNASNHKIIHINEALLELINYSEKQLIGKPWHILDKPSNHKHYKGYIKEMLANESVNFSTELDSDKANLTLNTNYHMGVLEGEIVYLGFLIEEKTDGMSNEIYECLELIHGVQNISSDMDPAISQMRQVLNLDFILYVEFNNNKIINSKSTGNRELAQSVLSNSKQVVIKLVKKNQKIKLDKSVNMARDNIEILSHNNLQSFCLYPIEYKNKIYGALISGGKNKVKNWNTISVLFSALAGQARLGLFQKSIIQKSEIEGQIDKITGLANRIAMKQHFDEIKKNGISEGKYLALMIVDIDRLNNFNKVIGIEHTNELKVSISKLLVKGVKSKGKVYRMSEDEFIILFKPHTNKNLSEAIVKNLISNLQKPILLSNGEDISINSNVGISIFPDEGQTISSMIKNADLAVSDAKLKNMNGYIVYKHSETGKVLKQQAAMIENLKKAIDKKHFTAFFQPKINAKSEDIIGFEALVRWIDPELGLINPGQFIPLAEETGLINQIGEFVTKFACDKLVQWQKRYGLTLSCSINLSAVQLRDLELPLKLEKIINSSGIHPHFIDFEITETINLDDIPNLVTSLNQIVDIGCTLSIDDYGTGHSSLDYVKKIPAKYIKIDQSFVRNIGLNPEDEAILDATIDIAKRLNREIVAEGVETESQREYLLERNCDYFQGYLFSRPLPFDEIDLMLKKRVKLMGSN